MMNKKTEKEQINIFDVANYVIHKIPDITNMKLQKIIYYIQGVYLAKHNEKMFDSVLEAWLYGPVFPELYLQIYKNSYNPVPIIEKGDKNKITEKQAKIIDLVIEKQGHKTASVLSEQTHNESPWLEVFEHDSDWELNAITEETLKTFFQKNDISNL